MIQKISVFVVMLMLVYSVSFGGNTDISWTAPYLLPNGHSNTSVAEWTSYSGEVFGFDDVIIVRLRFDQEAVDVFNYRSGFGLDVDIVQCINETPIKTEYVQHTFPDATNVVRDTTFGDELTSGSSCESGGNPYVIGTILLRDVENIQAENDYYVYFHLKDTLPTDGVRLHLTLQLSFDVQLVSNPLREMVVDSFGSDVLDRLDYFVVESDSYTSFDAVPVGNYGTCWGSKSASSNCSVIQNQCFAQMYEKKEFDFWDFIFSKAYAAECVSGSAAPIGSSVIGILPNPGSGHNLLPTGPNPEEIPGSRADLRPDFDIYHTDGHEISSNCNDCPSEPVEVGQSIKTVLTAQVANNDVDNSLRDSDSNSIEGPIWWRIAGKTNWTLLVSEEFDVDDLNEDDEPDEYEWFNVPSYPNDILEFKACVDGDDEILEPDEGSRKKITNPDQSGTTNNCSRTERFYIKPHIKTWDEFTESEQAAILQIILN